MKNSSAALAHDNAPATTSSATAWRVYQGAQSEKIDEKELIERYLPLVRNVVDRIKLNLPPHVDVDDLYSVGVTGLIAAVRKYDPEQGHTFAGYATTRIRGAILDELRRLDWCPRRARAKAKKLKESINELEQKLGRAASEEEVRKHLGLTPKEYAKWMEEAKPVCFVAIDQTADIEDSEGASLHELIADATERVLLMSYAAYTLSEVAADLQCAADRGCAGRSRHPLQHLGCRKRAGRCPRWRAGAGNWKPSGRGRPRLCGWARGAD